jgi:hypothetical protein
MSTPYAGVNVYPASFTIPDDGDAENAASINVALQALGDRTASLNARLSSAGNFPFRAAGLTTVFYDMAYSVPLRRWLFLAKDTSTLVRVYAWDAHSSTMILIGNTVTTAAVPTGIAVHPTATQLVMVTDFAGTTTEPIQTWDGTNFTTNSVTISNAKGIGATYFAGGYSVFLRTSTLTSVYRSTDGVTWSAVSSMGNYNARQMQFASSGSLCVAIHQNTLGGLTNTYSATSVVHTSTDGIAWTARTMPISAFWSGVSYDARRGLFVVACSDLANTFKCFTSPDGITWTQAGAGGKRFAAKAFGIAVHGDRWLLAATDTNLIARRFLAVSSDAGDTWGAIDLTPTWDGTSLNGGVGLEPRPVSNVAQCVLGSDGGALASLVLTPQVQIPVG